MKIFGEKMAVLKILLPTGDMPEPKEVKLFRLWLQPPKKTLGIRNSIIFQRSKNSGWAGYPVVPDYPKSGNKNISGLTLN